MYPLLVCVVVAVSAGACAPSGAASGTSEPRPTERPETPAPAIEQGPVEPAAEGRAAALLSEAREALAAEEHARARDAARRVVEEFPRASGSSEALLILALASMPLEDFAAAEDASARYARIHGPDHPQWGRSILLQAEALVHLDRREDAFELLLESEPDLTRERQADALDLVREHVRGTDADHLGALAEAYPDRETLLPPILIEQAISLHFLGEDAEARRLAEQVRSLARGTPEDELAEALLTGDVEGRLGAAPMIAALLPTSGSPALSEFGGLVEEGVRLAVELDTRDHRLPVALEIADDAGRPGRGAELARELEARGVFGFVGPLMDPAVDAVARELSSAIPVISPTARMLPADAEGVYSLSSVDPGSALLLAQYAGAAGLERIAVVYPRTPEATEEARLFTEAFRRDHVGFVVEIPYAPGQTNFAMMMLEVEDLGADALVLPLDPDGIEMFAPQIAYYGLDSLNVQVLGTSAWALDDVLGSIARRHTDNVIVATPRQPEGVRPEYESFTEAYEDFFQKSLVSRVPALGYDAAGLLLEAFRRSGARTPGELREALENVRDFPGATGTLSVIDGRIVREHTLVRLENRRVIPLEWNPGRVMPLRIPDAPEPGEPRVPGEPGVPDEPRVPGQPGPDVPDVPRDEGRQHDEPRSPGSP